MVLLPIGRPFKTFYRLLNIHFKTKYSVYRNQVIDVHKKIDQLFHDEGPYHIETSPLICIANQWIAFYMIETFVMKELTGSVIMGTLVLHD